MAVVRITETTTTVHLQNDDVVELSGGMYCMSLQPVIVVEGRMQFLNVLHLVRISARTKIKGS